MNSFELDLFDMRKEYSSEGFDEKALKDNPFDQFKIWFDQAVEQHILEPNAMVLATSSTDNTISQRVVLLKQINAEGFIFFTNYNSKKGRGIEENPKVALLFFWLEQMRQIRIEGNASKIPELESNKYFYSRPRESKASALLSKQSEPLLNKESFDNEVDQLIASQKQIERPVNWGGYIVKPTLFEFWQGGKSRSHDRFEYYKEDKLWKIRRLYP